MIPRLRRVSVAHALLLGGLAPLLAAAQDAPAEDADKKFDVLLAAAKESPEKADWMKLRRAFAETTRYRPYNNKWNEELDKIRTDLKGKDPKAAEAALDKLIEREGYMRLDAHGVASAYYRRTGQKEKEAFHNHFAQGIAGTIYVPGTGTSFEKPIVVLFIEEEYRFFDSLKLKATRQGLTERDGHKFDVFEVEEEGDKPTKFYFNIDLPYKTLDALLKPAPKKSADE